ncbi:MAG: hypothetical protein K2O54_05645, partial [Prevotella sp.]|nr:hypothetical protein [Prevotella sp.]
FSIWEEINTLFADLFQSIAYIFEAFADENGQQLTANIIGIGSYIFMGVAESASKFFRDIAGMIIQPFVDNQEAFRTALDDFLGILAEVTGTIKNGIEEIFADFNVMYDEHFKPFFDSVTEGLSNLVGKFFEFWNDNVQPVLQEWSAEFDTLWKESLQPFFSKLIEMFGNVADIFKAVWENAIMPLLDSIVTNVLPMILSIVDGIVVAVMKGVEVIIDIAAGAIDALNGIIKFLLDVFTGNWESIWNKVVEIFGGIWEAIKKIVNQILALIEGFANGIISGVNTVIRALNMLKLDVPDWVTDLTGIKDFGGFNIPEIGKVSIPRLATGTVVPPNREFLAVLGDNQREPE